MALFLPQKGTKAQIDVLPIVDGQLLWTTDQIENEIYYDDGLSRVTLKGGSSSYTPTATNLETIVTHIAIRRGGVGRYKLIGDSGTWVALSSYLICTLPEIYRPSIDVYKLVLFNADSTYIGYLSIKTDGKVVIQPRKNMTNQAIRIDEAYTL